MKLIVGLGNPGQSYARNRHNAGFMCISRFARDHRIPFERKKSNARIGQGVVDTVPVILARPQTYMNASGKAVGGLLRAFKLAIDDLIVVHDDLDLPLARIRVRKGGSSGGHNAVQSIIRDAGSADFVRVRIGIGRPPRSDNPEFSEQDVVDYVLADFTSSEQEAIDRIIPTVSEALQCILSEGFVSAMNRFNPRPE